MFENSAASNKAIKKCRFERGRVLAVILDSALGLGGCGRPDLPLKAAPNGIVRYLPYLVRDNVGFVKAALDSGAWVE